jgi:ankyrin repeat protein
MPLSKKQQELNDKLIEVCKNGGLSAFKDLIKQGANPKSKTFKLSPLILAAGFGHLDIVKCLLQYGINIDIYSYYTPISIACGNGHLEVVKYLHENNANIHINNDQVILFAAVGGHFEIVKYLHQNGANIFRAIDNDSVNESFREVLIAYKTNFDEKSLMQGDLKEGSLKPSVKGSGLRV